MKQLTAFPLSPSQHTQSIKAICQEEQFILKYKDNGDLDWMLSIPQNLPLESKQNLNTYKNLLIVSSNRLILSRICNKNYEAVIIGLNS